MQHVTYVCEGGVVVPVVFILSSPGDSYAVAVIGGRLLGMRNVVSASGARYRSGDGADAYQLWTKGHTAMISAGPEDQDRILFRACLSQP